MSLDSNPFRLIPLAGLLLGCSGIHSAGIRAEQSRTLTIIPLGNLSPKTQTALVRRLNAEYDIKITVAKASKLPKVAYYEPRNRFRADKLLEWLRTQSKSDFVLGITDRDISTTSGKHKDWGVFGLGECPGRAAMVSSFRLGKKGSVSPEERLIRVAIHEVGHNHGLPHCPNPCIMSDAKGSIKSVDATDKFCNSCRTELNE